MACGCPAAPCHTVPVRLPSHAAHANGRPSLVYHSPAVALAPFPAACKVAAPALEAVPRVCQQLMMSGCQAGCQVQLPLRQSSAASSVSKAGHQTPASTARVSTMASFAPPEGWAQAQQQEIDQLREQIQVYKANEARLQAELQAAREQIDGLTVELAEEKRARAQAVLALPAEKAPRTPKSPKSPQRGTRSPASARADRSRAAEPDCASTSGTGTGTGGTGTNIGGGDVAPFARPLSERPRVTRRGSSPAALRRIAKDEVDTKLTEYLTSSPHCKLEFCRLNQGWYQFRHADIAMETKCLEMSIVNGKLMVKLEPTSHDRGCRPHAFQWSFASFLVRSAMVALTFDDDGEYGWPVFQTLNAVSSVLSIAGSLLVIGVFMAFPQLRRYFARLVLYLAISDLWLCTSFLMGAFQKPHYTKCTVQALLGVFFGLSSVLWTVAIADSIRRIVMARDLTVESRPWPQLALSSLCFKA
ncbi:GCR1 [Symbiodinium natans]|uniref:GCR1 protein n=1 Tax=Symbiodinium natans TaxID=878477 RepID=A0A812G6K6_9DINO|nr:GCR1 [Symbiodinium natans]